MVSPLHSNGTAERTDNIISAFSDLAPKPDLRPELLLRLAGKLQVTLDLNQLLEIFFSEIQNAVLVDGISYQHDALNLTHQCGRLSTHSVSYQLQTQNQMMGDITFHRSTRYREHELANIEGLMSTLVYPVRNALRYQEALQAAFRDPLTGTGNRAALNNTLSREIEMAKRHNQPLSLLMLDLDKFKQVNDRHGHSTGDQVLISAANCILQCIRQTDMCFRYGGEEFLIMLSNANHGGALRIAERIRHSIAELQLEHKEQMLKITTSIGCATMNDEDDMESLIQRADGALYQAKRSGRNRVITDQEQSQLSAKGLTE